MNVLQLIASRRSIAKLQDKKVPTTILEKILEAGCWAPTHKRTEPWNFAVFTDKGREKLQQAINSGFANLYADLPAEEQQQKLEAVKALAYRAPVVIGVWSAVGRGKVNPPPWEDCAATAACLQNMCLATHSLGLGCIWRTGSVVDMPEVQALCANENNKFNLEKGDKIIGFLYIGYEDKQATHPSRETPEYKTKTTWIMS